MLNNIGNKGFYKLMKYHNIYYMTYDFYFKLQFVCYTQ